MNSETFYQRIINGTTCPPLERHALFAQLHSEVVADYLEAVRKITPDQASRKVASGIDLRTIAQVVGHIAAWEQFAILASGDILAGVQHPRMITTVEGFVTKEGRRLDFPGIDAFNAFHAEEQSGWTWERIQELAIGTATTLHILFTHPTLLTAERLERTKPFRKRLQNGIVVEQTTMGWNLWITVLEHEAVEHAFDLEIE